MAQTFSSQLNGFNDLTVTRAATDVTRNCLDDIFARRLRFAIEQCLRGEDHARRTKPALHAMCFTKGVLDNAQFSGCRCEPLYCLDRIAVCLSGEHKTGTDSFTIEKDGTGPAHSVLTARMA